MMKTRVRESGFLYLATEHGKNAVTGEAISPENGKLFVEVPPCGCVLIEKES